MKSEQEIKNLYNKLQKNYNYILSFNNFYALYNKDSILENYKQVLENHKLNHLFQGIIEYYNEFFSKKLNDIAEDILKIFQNKPSYNCSIINDPADILYY